MVELKVVRGETYKVEGEDCCIQFSFTSEVIDVEYITDDYVDFEVDYVVFVNGVRVSVSRSVWLASQ